LVVPGLPYFPPVEALWALEEGMALMHDKSSRRNHRTKNQPSVLMLRFALASLQFRASRLLTDERREYPATLPVPTGGRRDRRRASTVPTFSSRLMKGFLAQSPRA
jgi:hypothetical protein